MIMKKRFIPLFVLPLVLASCGGNSSSNSSSSISGDDVEGSTTDVEVDDDDVSDSFSLVDSTGVALSGSSGVYSITAAGEYTASGKLSSGQIYVNVGDEDEVILNLSGVSIANSSVSPIFVNNCGEFDLKATKNTTNYVYDNRSTDYSESDDDSVGKGAIYAANGDINIKGKGTLSVTSLANSGVHSKDNVSVKNVTMIIKAVNNGIRGNDKVTIEENPTLGIVCGNNGIRTVNTDVSSSGNQRGYVYIYGGTITINSYGDGIDASYGVVIDSSVDEDDTSVTYTPVIDVYTNIYSSYSYSAVSSAIYRPGPGGSGGGFDGGGMSGGTSAEKADDSAKAIKAATLMEISDGEIFTYTYDDGLHSDGSLTISGGTIKQKASDDGIHAEGALKITDGVIYISESYEGIEGGTITISGGEMTVFADNDAVNASSSLLISGGRVDASVPSSGDSDCLDSNGSFTISGGVVIARGPNSEMASPIDVDSTPKFSGGTIIIIGYAPTNVSVSGLTKTSSSNGLSSGSHTVTVGSLTVSYSNSSSYSGTCTVYGSGSATVK